MKRSDVNEETQKILMDIGIIFEEEKIINKNENLYEKLNEGCFGFKKGKKTLEYSQLNSITKKKLNDLFIKKDLKKTNFSIYNKMKYFNCLIDNDKFKFKKTNSFIKTKKEKFGVIEYFISFNFNGEKKIYVMINLFKKLGFLLNSNICVLTYNETNDFILIDIDEVSTKCSILRAKSMDLEFLKITKNETKLNQKIKESEILELNIDDGFSIVF